MRTKNAEKKNTNESYRRMPSAPRFGSFLHPLLLLSGLLACMIATPQVQSLAAGSHDTSSGRRLGLLTFDLDDTLFCTSTVVKEGNVEMLKRMAAYDCKTHVSEFQAATRTIRQGLTDPIAYTDLRKRAIRSEMERLTGQTPDTQVVDECFDAWLEERNAAAGRNLLPHTVAGLQAIRDKFPEACVGAITNGRGDPAHIDPLKPFFEFCVSGEDKAVFPARKPSPGIYEKALELYRKAYRHHGDESHLWIHVGDCLANDVGASSALGACAIWYAPGGEEIESAAAQLSTGKRPFYSTASKEDLDKRARLAEEAQKNVSVRIESLKDLPSAIERLLEELTTGTGTVEEAIRRRRFILRT